MKKKEPGKIEKIEIVNKKKDVKKVDLKKTLTLGKSVSQNYLKTINKKKVKKITDYNTVNRNITMGRNIKKRTLNADKNKFINSVDFGSNQVDLDISGDNKGLFEYRADSKNTKKNPFKKKAPVTCLKKELLKNDSGLLKSRNSNNSGLLHTQNSYEY